MGLPSFGVSLFAESNCNSINILKLPDCEETVIVLTYTPLDACENLACRIETMTNIVVRTQKVWNQLVFAKQKEVSASSSE